MWRNLDKIFVDFMVVLMLVGLENQTDRAENHYKGSREKDKKMYNSMKIQAKKSEKKACVLIKTVRDYIHIGDKNMITFTTQNRRSGGLTHAVQAFVVDRGVDLIGLHANPADTLTFIDDAVTFCIHYGIQNVKRESVARIMRRLAARAAKAQ